MLSRVRMLMSVLSITTKILKSQLLIMWDYQNKNISANGYATNWSTVPYTYAISDLQVHKIGRRFCLKRLKITSQKKLKVEKIIKRKGNGLRVKLKGYVHS